MDILIYIICIVLGIAVGLLIGRNRKKENELEAQVKVLESRNASLTDQAARDKEEWQAHTRDMLDAQQAKFDETIAKVTAQMKSGHGGYSKTPSGGVCYVQQYQHRPDSESA